MSYPAPISPSGLGALDKSRTLRNSLSNQVILALFSCFVLFLQNGNEVLYSGGGYLQHPQLASKKPSIQKAPLLFYLENYSVRPEIPPPHTSQNHVLKA